VRFRGATSIVSVCGFCKSTLVRSGVDIENIGRQAELLEDQSPIRIGTDGKHRGVTFNVVGRIQFRYEGGTWNEWHVLFADGKSGWLSDASREYTITYPIPPQVVKPFEALKPETPIHILGDKWYSGKYTVTNLDTGEVVAGEGELPFKFTSGWKANVADLRGDGARFATIDYSEVPPRIYVGEKLPFDTLAFSGLRDPGQGGGFTKGTAAAFKCAGCGAPIEKHLTTTEVVACGSCGTVTDVTGTVGELVQKNERNVAGFKPVIPLGTVGRWKNTPYEVVGFMRRGVTVEGVQYQWSEYLLHNVQQGYAWITEYNGHYNFVKNAAEIPRDEEALGQPRVKYLGRSFKHFQKCEAKVTYLTGEFYWRVQLGETANCNDYVAPPLIVSSEGTGKEISWSVGEYVEPGMVFKAFALKSKPRAPIGVAPNQPSPHEGKVGPYWLAFIAFLALGFVAQLLFAFMQSSAKPPALTFAKAGDEQATRVTSAPFKVGGFGAMPLTVRTTTNASSDWVSVDLQLTNADTGRAYGAKRSLGFTNIGGSLQGSSVDVAEVPGVPAGRYTLAVEARSPKAVSGSVEVYRSRIGWSNFWLFAGFIGLWPLLALVRSMAFEKKRWMESDYAPEDSDSDLELDDD
jgi:hypothetical protein